LHVDQYADGGIDCRDFLDELKKEPPTPPYSSGISMPMRPRSKRRWIILGDIFWASSISRTSGAISFRANLRTVSWRICSSAVSVESGAGSAVSIAIAGMGEESPRTGCVVILPEGKLTDQRWDRQIFYGVILGEAIRNGIVQELDRW
jgi:hypothetical protein